MSEDDPENVGCQYHSQTKSYCPYCTDRSTAGAASVPTEAEIAYFLGDAEADEVYPNLVDVTLSITVEADDCHEAIETIERHLGETNLGICRPTVEKAERRGSP